MIDHAAIRFFGDIPAAQARARGERIALQSDAGSLTYGELHDRVGRAMTALAAEGVGAGDRVCWLGASGLDWFTAFFATVGLRACFSPLNLRLAPGEIAYMLTDSEAAVLLVTASEIELAQAAVAAMEQPVRIVTVGFDHPGLSRLAVADSAPRDPLPQREEDDILQLYTSGTTGKPKGVRLTNGNYAGFLLHSGGVQGFDYDEGETLAIVMPLYHVAGSNVSLAGLAHGCRVIVEQAFDAARVLDLIQRERVAQIFLAPTLIRMLLDADGDGSADFSSLRTVGYGASPITEALLAEAQQRMGCQFTQYYGMTESAGTGTYLAPADHRPDMLRSCGQAWPGMEARIARPDGSTAAPGEVGEIVLRGAMVSPGYWRREEATAELLRDGWLHTGDAGYADAQGYLFVHDRIKDMIVSGGENVYPAEVENAIAGCPGVGDVAVIGVPSERWGEAVKAVIVPAPGESPSGEAVMQWVRQRIAGYKVPKSVEFVDALPRNASGKVLRRELRDRYWAGQDRAIA
jgi:acyl-CoA synthetase (AMP-forming)/AMP-acid ligase II